MDKLLGIHSSKGLTLLVIVLLLCIYSCKEQQDLIATIPPSANPNTFDWTFQRSDLLVDFTDVYFVSETTGWVVGENNLLLSTVSGGAQWPEAPINAVEGNFRSVYLLDEQRGWISGDVKNGNLNGSVLVSINGGAYPESQKLTEFPINSVFMLNENYGWAAGEQGQVIYTTDGQSWNESITDLSFDIHDIHFVDEQNGWIAGAEGNIYRSADGGLSWYKEMRFPDTDLLSIQMADTTVGWVCGSRNTFLTRSLLNGEISWKNQGIEQEFNNILLNDLHFINENTGWVVGSEGIVYKTSDGGISWIKESTSIFTDLRAIHMVSSTTGWIAGDAGVILTYTP